MSIQDQVIKMDEMVAQGAIVNAVKTFFAENAETSDYDNVKTSGKSQMVAKMEGFVDAIAEVNGITLHHTLVNDTVSASEFTFDFSMKDGSSIYWHEVIRRLWDEDGQVVKEEYFIAQP